LLVADWRRDTQDLVQIVFVPINDELRPAGLVDHPGNNSVRNAVTAVQQGNRLPDQ
jgi:hypothetical protein